MKDSTIEWTDHTFNPWIGCAKVSPGCANCYAETLMDKRLGRAKWGKGHPRSKTSFLYWLAPISWNRKAVKEGNRPRVFCSSLADWLDDEVPGQWLVELLDLIRLTPNLDWLLLTKRPELFNVRLGEVGAALDGDDGAFSELGEWVNDWAAGQAPQNVWAGASAEDQTRWDERLPHLLNIPAKVHFVSAEPLLGEIRMGSIMRPDWLIVGGESGPGARPMQPGWVRNLRADCAPDVSFFFKQWGGVDKKKAGRTLDGWTWNAIPFDGGWKGRAIRAARKGQSWLQ